MKPDGVGERHNMVDGGGRGSKVSDNMVDVALFSFASRSPHSTEFMLMNLRRPLKSSDLNSTTKTTSLLNSVVIEMT